MWGKSKRGCATDWYPKRGIEGTYLALMKSWYGGPGRSHLYYHSQITAAQCEKWIGHSESKMDLYITKISRKISGTVPNITLDGTAEYQTDSDSGSDDDDPGDGQLSD